MAGAKRRLDVLLVERGLVESREKAQALVMAGQVWVQGQRVDKAGKAFPPDVEIEVKGEACPYVSRGGLKLEGALDSLDIDVADKVVADFGASTGGFTHCLLARGAKKVYALDVGYGQLHWILRQDPRVVVMEKVNVRYLEAFHLGEEVDMVVADLSFISLTLVLPAVKRALRGGGEALLLVKPQFEVGREKVGKGGVVRDPALHRKVIENLTDFFEASAWVVEGYIPSPLLGPKGNREFLIYLTRG